MYDLIPPEAAQRRRAFVDKVIRIGDSMRFEDHLDGRIVDNCLTPVLDEEGNVERIAVIGIDITARKSAERALRESEQKLRTLFAILPTGVSILDGQRRITDMNFALETIMDMPKNELLEGKLEQRKHVRSDGTPMPADEFPSTQALREQRPILNTEVGILREHGRTIWTDVSAAPLPGFGVAVVTADITKRKQRERELEAIGAMGAALRVAGTRAEMFTVILDQLVELLHMDGASLVMRDPVSGTISTEMGRGVWTKLAGTPLPADESVTGRVIGSGGIYLSNDLKNDPQVARPESIGDLGHAVCVPLTVRGQNIGAIWVGRQTPIAKEDVRLLTAIADIAANAIQRETLHEETERHVQRLTGLFTIDRAISASLDLKVTLGVLLDQTVNQLKVDAADILLYKPLTSILEFADGRGLRTGRVKSAGVHLGDDYAGRAALEQRTIMFKDWRSEVPEKPKVNSLMSGLLVEGFLAYVAVPLIAKGQLKGVLEILHRAPWRLMARGSIFSRHSPSKRRLLSTMREWSTACSAPTLRWSALMMTRSRGGRAHSISGTRRLKGIANVSQT